MERNFYELKEYISLLEEKGLIDQIFAEEEDLKKRVRHVSYSSKDIGFNTLFICKGAHFSEGYLHEALGKGAFAYVSEKKYNVDAPCIKVDDIRKVMPLIADFFYERVWRRICIAGVTGTKGKSTTAYYMKSILDQYLKASKKPESAIISGIDNYDGIIKEESHLTTPEALMLHRHFDNAVKSGIEYISMEVSSQALKYHRTKGIIFDVACFLNLGTDHISDIEHQSFEDYSSSKLIFFRQCKAACVNLDDDYADKVINEAKKSKVTEKIITFGSHENANIHGYDLKPGKKGITFKVRTDSFDTEFEIGMTGLFNVSNALAAISMSYALDIPLEYIKSGLKKARAAGRMEIFHNEDETLTVVVDYAHNQMSFESLFASTKKEYPGKKIFIVFGCPGKKALGRRKELGDIAGKYADKSFITEEDAGEEPVHEISEEIMSHIKEQGGNCVMIDDREEAIKRAINEADGDTVILITGKGRETRQKRGIEYIETPSDVEYVLRFLKEKKC